MKKSEVNLYEHELNDFWENYENVSRKDWIFKFCIIYEIQ